MYLIDNSTAATTQPPSSAAGTPGFFTDGNPATNVPATIFPAEFANAQMLELCNVVTGAGLTLNKAAFNQLFTAIQALIKGAGQGINSGSYINTTGKVNAVNSPNLLYNSSGEFGLSKWSGSGFNPAVDLNGGGQMFLLNPAINNQTITLNSAPIPCNPNTPLVLSLEMHTQTMTGGNICADIVCFDSGSNNIGYICNVGALAAGQPWTFKSAAGVAPANTASITPRFYTQNATGAINSCGFRRIKCELGTVPSLYSREADNGVTVPQFDNSIAPATTQWVRSFGIQSSGMTAYNVNTSLPLASIGGTVYAYGASNLAFNLPAPAGLPVGAHIEVINASGSPLAISVMGGANINIGSTVVPTVFVPMNDSAIFVLNAGGAWFCVSGGAMLAYSGSFASLYGGNGYQKVMSMLLQYGTGTASAASATAVTLPITFPNAGLAICAIPNVSNSSFGAIGISQMTQTNFTCWANAGSPSFTYLAFGH